MITTSPVPDFITVEELKGHLKKSGVEEDAKLSGFVSAACQMIVDRIGQVSPVVAVDVDHRHHRHHLHRRIRRTIVLEERPVISVTTVVVDGATVPAADLVNGVDGWELSGPAGILTHTGCWPWGRITVTYTAGRLPLPGNVRLAALELAGHLWKQSQLNNGSTARPQSFGDDQVIMRGAAYALPIRVRELLGLGKNPTDDILVG